MSLSYLGVWTGISQTEFEALDTHSRGWGVGGLMKFDVF